jgi:two-component sensor histidine kinase
VIAYFLHYRGNVVLNKYCCLPACLGCLQAQQQQLERAEGAFQRSAGRLREMQQHLASHGGSLDAADGGQVLQVLQDDVARLRLQVLRA